MTSDLPEAFGPVRPPNTPPLEFVLERIAAQVLRLAIPDTPFGKGSAAAEVPIATPQVDGFEPPLIEVPPVVEPVFDPDTSEPTKPPPDPAIATEHRIASLRAAAPRPIAPVVLGMGADRVAAPAQEAPPAERPAPAALPAGPVPFRPRSLRVHRPRPTLRRVQPRLPGERPVPAPRTTPHAGLSQRLSRAGETRAARDPAERPAPIPAPTGLARAPFGTPVAAAPPPARTRPMLAPTGLAAPVPETRPLTQNRRLYRRVTLAAELTVDGVSCRLVDLSIAGFAAAGAPKLTPQSVVPVTLKMNIDGIDIGTQFSARVIYANEARSAGRFIDLTAAQSAFLRYIVTWRGEAIGAIGTTNLLNAITRWPMRALQPQPDAAAAGVPPPQRGWWSRWFGRIPLLGRRRGE